jgi:hypothetical protein
MSDPQVQPPAGPSATPTGFTGMVSDASTLASTGLVAAVLFSTVAGLIGAFSDPGTAGVRGRLLNLTDTVDVGDVAILGIAVALLLLTPDPPGGVRRPLLLQLVAFFAAVITIYGVIRSLVLISSDELNGVAVTGALRVSGFVATVGVSIAAATISFYAAKESFLKKEGRI